MIPERERKRDIKKGLISHYKEFGVFSAWDGKSLKDVE